MRPSFPARLCRLLTTAALSAAAIVAVTLGCRSVFYLDRMDAYWNAASRENRGWSVVSFYGVLRVIRQTTSFEIVGARDRDTERWDAAASFPRHPPIRHTTPIDAQLGATLNRTHPTRWFGAFGFGFHTAIDRTDLGLDAAESRMVERSSTLDVPYWFLALALGLIPLRRAWLWRRARHRVNQAHCPHCNYDLRAHIATPNPRCPECGAAVPPPPAAASPTK